MLFNAVFVEGRLEDLIVFHVLVIELGAPLNLTQVESARVNCVHNLAVDTARRALLNL